MNIDKAAMIWTVIIVIIGVGFTVLANNSQQITTNQGTVVGRPGGADPQGMSQLQGIDTKQSTGPQSAPIDTLTSKITVSLWVKPDYADSAARLTALSKENSFVISINNNLTPKHAVNFLVYDGRQWTEITSASEINDLSHIAGVIDQNNISLYVNGKLEKQKIMKDIFIVDSGRLNVTKAEVALPEGDVMIGGYNNTLRGEQGITLDLFSGIIEDVKIFDDEALTTQRIQEMYLAGPNSIAEVQVSP